LVSPPLATDGAEHPIPIELRSIFSQIVDAWVAGDYQLQSLRLDEVELLDRDLADGIVINIQEYGAELASLHPDVWQRSCYSRQEGRWQAIIDLTTKEETVSDLAMHADLFLDPELRIKVWSVHVP